jgi:hypothetical protein
MSVVTQALLYNFGVQVSSSLSSDDVDDDCQWELHVSVNWIRTRVHHRYRVAEGCLHI